MCRGNGRVNKEFRYTRIAGTTFDPRGNARRSRSGARGTTAGTRSGGFAKKRVTSRRRRSSLEDLADDRQNGRPR